MKAVALAAGFCYAMGCSNNDSDLAIYIPGAETAVKAGFYIEDEPHVQIFNVTVTLETYPRLTEYELPNGTVVHLQADPGKIDKYNTKNGTEYKLLPEAAYDLIEEVLVKAGIPKPENVVTMVYAKDNIEAFKEYLLPVGTTSIEGAVADDCCQTIYFILRESVGVSSIELLGRTGWEALDAPSEEPKEGGWGRNGLEEVCLDDDLDTFWGADWSSQHPQPPHWIVIDLEKTTHIQGLVCQTHEKGYGGSKEVIVGVNGDSATQTVVAKFKDIPTQGEFRSFLPDVADGRYLKVTITAVNDGPYVMVGELDLF